MPNKIFTKCHRGSNRSLSTQLFYVRVWWQSDYSLVKSKSIVVFFYLIAIWHNEFEQWKMISSIIKIVILLSKFIMGNSSFWTYSSCVQDSHWINGNGAPIKSWIQSTLPTFNSKDSPFSKIVGIHVTFQYQSIPRVDLIGWFSNNWKSTLSKSIFLY